MVDPQDPRRETGLRDPDRDTRRRRWDQRYAASDLVWSAEPNRFLVEEASALVPGQALDLGAGEGRNAIWLAERGWRVTAVDVSGVGLEKAGRLAARRGVPLELVRADLLDYEPPASAFDLVILFYVHLPAGERRVALARAGAALAPGGTLLVVGHDRSNLTEGCGGPQDAAVLFTPNEIAAELPGLRIVRAQQVIRTVETEAGPRQAVDALVRAERAD